MVASNGCSADKSSAKGTINREESCVLRRLRPLSAYDLIPQQSVVCAMISQSLTVSILTLTGVQGTSRAKRFREEHTQSGYPKSHYIGGADRR